MMSTRNIQRLDHVFLLLPLDVPNTVFIISYLLLEQSQQKQLCSDLVPKKRRLFKMKHNQQRKPKEVRTEKKIKICHEIHCWEQYLQKKKMQHLPIFTTIQTFHIQAVRGSFVSNDYRGPRGDSDVLRSGSHSQSLLNT